MIETWCDHLAGWLFGLAKWLNPDLKRAEHEGREAQKVAYDLVYGRIDAKQAREQFYAIYY